MTSEPSSRKTRILAIFGNVAYMGQERANVFVLDLLQKSGKAECLLAVNDRGVQWYVQPHLDSAGLAYRKMRFCWNLHKDWRPRIWWLHLTDIIRSNREFYRIWCEWRPDFIHCGNAFQMMTLLPVLTVIPTPVIFRLGDEPEGAHPLWRWLWKGLVRRVNQFVCNSRFVQGKLLAIRDVTAKCRVIYNYPPARMQRSKPDASIPSPQFGLFTVVYMGQISENKGVILLLDAAILFLKFHPNARFIIAGPTEPPQHQHLAQSLIKKVEDIGVSDKIIFTGIVEDVPTMLVQGHVHICPSIYEEPSANVITEAKLAARPSIVFATGGSPELVTHQRDGYVCGKKTSAAIMEALEYYHALPDWGRTQGESALKSLDSLGITYDHFRNAWLNVYGLADDPPRSQTHSMRNA
jgi:glycosyltransferase involved in cell wall biosynthesis